MVFRDRRDAGRQLAEQVLQRSERLGPDPIVLALPRGGVPVGFEVARALGAPLDVFVVRKLGVPGHEELAMGAIASGDVVVLNTDLINSIGIPEEIIDRRIAAARVELERREREYRQGAPLLVADRGVILVDDGLATGSTMLAAIAALRKLDPARITVAVPVAALETLSEMDGDVAQLICVVTPEPFFGVGRWYEDFSQTSDDEVRALLRADAG